MIRRLVACRLLPDTCQPCTSRALQGLKAVQPLLLTRAKSTSIKEYHAPDWDMDKHYGKQKGRDFAGPNKEKWNYYNEVVWKPGTLDDDGIPKRREVYHMLENCRGHWRKAWRCTEVVVGMPIDEAVRQLSFMGTKFSTVATEALEEAREKALTDHNFEFRSNMWIAAFFPHQSLIYKGYRRHARMRFATLKYRYHHIFVHLVEGQPPPNYTQPLRMNHWDKADAYLKWMRSRHVILGL